MLGLSLVEFISKLTPFITQAIIIYSRTQNTETMQELIKSLVKAKKEFSPIQKDRTNPFLKNKYATLDSILSSVEPALLENGLFISQLIESDDRGSYLRTVLYHESGEFLESSRYDLPNVNDSQKFGAAITYARRYQLSALLNITADTDDDGNSSSGNNSGKRNNDEPVFKSPFKSPDEAIQWGVKQTGKTTEEVTEIMANVTPDENGKKAAPFKAKIRELVTNQQNGAKK